jgi:hypothetical protein
VWIVFVIMNKSHSITLIIGGKYITLTGVYPMRSKWAREYKPERYSHFIHTGKIKADIQIKVEIVKKLPKLKGEQVFKVIHFDDGKENWRWLNTKTGYTYYCPLGIKRQVAIISRDYSKITVYVLPYRKKFIWDYRNILYDFLQILIINYLAYRKEGLILHACAVKDREGRGLAFAGRSGNGKSTLARFWHYNTKEMILNDDRVLVRKTNRGWIAYGTPWHGEFGDYMDSHPGSVALTNLFFIEHAKKNFAQAVDGVDAFKLLYPTLIPIFYDEAQINNVLNLCEELIGSTPCCKLGFTNNKEVIDFIRKTVDKTATL